MILHDYDVKSARNYWQDIEKITGTKKGETELALMERDVRITMLQKIWDEPDVLGHLVGMNDLIPMHGDWIKLMWDNLAPGEDRSMMAHRGSMKTSSVSQVGILRRLIFNPQRRIALFRPDRTGATVITEVVRNWYRMPSIIALLAGQPLNYDLREQVAKQINLKWGFMGNSPAKEGNLDAWGMRGSTGYHYDDLVICDIVTIDDRTSRVIRETKKAFVRELRTSVRDADSNVLMEGTTWHREDVWSEFPPVAIYNCYQTGLLSEAQIQKKRDTTTKVDFACNYELQHINSADQIFTDPTYGEFGKTKKPAYMHIDAKYDGDHTGGITLMQQRTDDKWAGKGWVFEDHVDNHLDFIVAQCLLHNVRWCRMEKNADKGYLVKALRKKAKEKRCKTKFANYDESTNKHVKIQSYGKAHWRNVVWDKTMEQNNLWESDPDIPNGHAYINQIVMYIDGEELNDAADSFASIMRELTDKNRAGLWG